jgi:hypothetical protein
MLFSFPFKGKDGMGMVLENRATQSRASNSIAITIASSRPRRAG